MGGLMITGFKMLIKKYLIIVILGIVAVTIMYVLTEGVTVKDYLEKTNVSYTRDNYLKMTTIDDLINNNH